MGISVGPTGRLIQGDVTDVNKKHLEEVVQHYDELLYIKWNPNKNRGWGSWELRRRPQYKTIVETIQLTGIGIQRLDYKELDIENHVFDLPVLSYGLLDRIKKADIWAKIDYNGKQGRVDKFAADANTNYFGAKDKAVQKAHDEMIYGLKQDKHIIEDFRERLRSGVDPKHLLRYWGKSKL